MASRQKTYPYFLDYHTKTSFFEVACYFDAKLVKLIFGKYDKSKKIEIFLTAQEARQIIRDIRSGALNARMQGTKENEVVYATQPKGTGGRYRYFSIIRGSKAPYVLVGQSGPGEATPQGLVKIAGPPDQTVIIPVPMIHNNVTGPDGRTGNVAGGLQPLADALEDAVAACNEYMLLQWMKGKQKGEAADNVAQPYMEVPYGQQP